MSDNHVVEVIRAVGRETGVPEEVVEAVVRRMLPSIRLVPEFPQKGEAPSVGRCRIGGVPDLPEGVEWPRLTTDAIGASGSVVPAGTPLSFLVQVNLAEVAFADLEQLLPRSGMLYFFFHGGVGDRDVAAVLFARGARVHRTTTPLDPPPDYLYRGFDLVPNLEWTVPLPGDLGLADHLKLGDEFQDRALGLWDELEDRVAAVQGYESPRTYGRGYAVHRLLGHAQFIQADGMGQLERLLLQVSTDAGLSQDGYPESGIGATWHDCGRIYYLLDNESLKSHRFAETFVTVECA
jgi:uncharacterized protein YwqG